VSVVEIKKWTTVIIIFIKTNNELFEKIISVNYIKSYTNTVILDNSQNNLKDDLKIK